MGNTEKKEPKKFKRKIRIRLADPNIPDSYICEIFDSSLENEDDEFSRNDNILEKRKDNPSKPKNYFDLLMSKNGKKNYVKKGECGIGTSIDDDHDGAFQRGRQKVKTKSRSSLAKALDTNTKEIKYEFESLGHSFSNKNILQVQTKIKSENMVLRQSSDCKKDLKEEDVQNDNWVTIFDSPKPDLTRKKTLSILNYFSKKEVIPDHNVKCHKLEERSGEKSKTSQQEKKIQHYDMNDPKKACKNGAKKVLLNGINKENLKLASLCYGKNSNSVIDLGRQKSHLEFLYKGSPSAAKKSENKIPGNTFYFPIVTHVQQRNESACWSVRQICLPLQKVYSSECSFNKNKKFSLQIKKFPTLNESESEDRTNFNKELLCKIKYKYIDLNLDSVIDGLKTNRDRFSAQMDETERSKINLPKASKDDLEYEELNTLWTEKYKPKTNEILGNADAIRKLKRWLQTWKCFNDELKILADCSQRSKNKKDSSDDDDDDDDDFLDFANKNYGLKVPGNVCIITGPNGCGKSTLVYALANELEFNVLELNASTKRTGKKVLSDLKEATRSHKFHQAKLPQPILVQAAAKKKKVKKQKKNITKAPVRITDQTNDCKISLILIEDADIVFDDHDEGFCSAIASLVQTSKRPLIFIANEPNFSYLENLKMDQCLKLEMEPPNFYKSCAVLDVVSSLEGVRFEKEVLESVVRNNNFDLRRSLLELQFWFGSGRRIKNIKRIFDLGHLWWGLSKFLFNQNVMHPVKCKGRKRKRNKDLFDSSDDEVDSAAKKFKSDVENSNDLNSGKAEASGKVLDLSIESYFRVLDVTSALDNFGVTGNGEPLPGNEYRLKDSLALCENMEEVLWGRRITEELSVEMMRLSAKIFLKTLRDTESLDRKLSFDSPCWEEVRWRDSQAKASRELSGLVSLQKRVDKRSLYLDYLPVLRNICRIERRKSQINPKRKNRFYHYLNNLGPEPTEEYLDISCKVFSRLF